MLRVSPDERVVWVQTAGTNMNYVLDVETMAVLNAVAVGRDPEQSAIQPNGGPYGLIAHLASTFLMVLDSTTGDEVTRIELGSGQANVSYTPDGAIAFVTLTDAGEVIALDMERFEVVGRLHTGPVPMGLVLLDAGAVGSIQRSASVRDTGAAAPTGARRRAPR